MNLSMLVKEIRNRLKISQRQLGIIIDSNQTEISFIERGFIPSSESKINKIKRLSRELNIDEEIL